MIDTVLFDIGGTLITSTSTPQRAVCHARYVLDRLKEHGISIESTAEDFARMIYERSEEYKHWGEKHMVELPNHRIWSEFILKDYCIGEELLKPVSEELSFCHDYLRLNNQPREGLWQMLEDLHGMGMKLGIISNIISRSFVPHILMELGVDHFFQDIVTSEGCGIRKPSAKIFCHALSRMGSGRETTCYVGDTISRDVLGCRNAGIALCIKIKNPSVTHRDAAFQGQDAPKADYEIERLTEIPAIIRSHNGSCNRASQSGDSKDRR